MTPAECVAHWLADSVEIMIDPRGDSSADDDGDRVDVQARRLPVHERSGEHERERRERPVLVARRRQPPGLLDRAARRHGRRRPERAGRRGRLERHVGRAATRRRADHAYAGGGYASRSRSRSPSCRRRSIPRTPRSTSRRTTTTTTPRRGRRRCATSTRGRRASPGRRSAACSRTRGCGASDVRGLHAAGRPADGARAAERRRTRTSTGSTRRRRSPSRRATACRSPAASRRRATTGSTDVDVDLDRDAVTIDLRASGPGRARIFLWSGEKGYIPVWVDELLAGRRSAAGLRPDAVRGDRRRRRRRGRRT